MDEKTFTFWDDTGDAAITVYKVFPGVQLAYHSVHMDQLHLDAGMRGNLIEIHHCREGHIEQEFDDFFFYLTPGDLSIARKTQMAEAYRFPLRHYHGVTIGVDVAAVPEALRQMFNEIGVWPMDVTKKLCADKPCFILRAERQIEHIFSELYSVSGETREGCFKLKILELFLALSSVRPDRNQLPACTLSKSNVRLANQAAAILSERINEHVTIPELARALGLSQSHLKTIFKSVYGVPVFSYMRVKKMQTAGQALLHTEKTIAEIADEFGYLNASKFSSAFQSVMGETPSEYRKTHRRATMDM